MDTFLITFHSYNRFFVLAALVFLLFRAYSGWLGRKPFEIIDDKASLVLMILSDVQLLAGLVLYAFLSTWTQTAFANFGAAMKDPMQRYFAVEQIAAMLLAIGLIHAGRFISKKAQSPERKHKILAIYTTIALLIIVGTLAQKGLLFGRLP